jgi:hypothetical protein
MNKTQKFVGIIAAVAALVIASQVYAFTETWSANTPVVLALEDQATAVPQGCLIEIGTVAPANLSAIINAAYVNKSPSQVEGLFVPFTTGLVGDGWGMDGLFTRTDGVSAPGLTGKQVYILAFDAATAAGAGEVGLFAVTNNANWLFPADDDLGTGSVDLGDAGLVALIGSLGAGTIASPTDLLGLDAAALYTIPEPSTLMLVGLGLFGAVGLMRRHHS